MWPKMLTNGLMPACVCYQGLYSAAISLSGSPNITIGMREAELQNADLVSPPHRQAR
jgi:hypothetical protein